MKKIIYVFIVAISIFNLSYAGCGSCNVSGKKADSPEGNFITSIGIKGNRWPCASFMRHVQFWNEKQKKV